MKKTKSDKGLMFTVFALLIFGLIILYDASAVIAHENTGKTYYYLVHQLIYGAGVGTICFFIFRKINYKIYKKFSLFILFGALALSAAVFIPQLGFSHGGAQRWIVVGPINFQPSEFLKLAFVIYLAAFFSKQGKLKHTINTLIPFLLITALIGGLMALQTDAGTLGIIMIVGFAMYFLGGANLRQLVIVLVSYGLAFFALIKFFPHRIERFLTFINPSVDPQGISYQINQALIAIGSGGIIGVGIGHSIQKYSYLPEVMGDSIFAIVAEEAGFIGAIILIALYILLIIKGFKIAKKTTDEFGKLLSCGIVLWIGLQALINMAAITGLIPLTGIPLPFVSYGGSALIITMTGMGILSNISKHTI